MLSVLVYAKADLWNMTNLFDLQVGFLPMQLFLPLLRDWSWFLWWQMSSGLPHSQLFPLKLEENHFLQWTKKVVNGKKIKVHWSCFQNVLFSIEIGINAWKEVACFYTSLIVQFVLGLHFWSWHGTVSVVTLRLFCYLRCWFCLSAGDRHFPYPVPQSALSVCPSGQRRALRGGSHHGNLRICQTKRIEKQFTGLNQAQFMVGR